jgi:putative CRISPR-associated protein (TIGR02619 family)
MKTIITTVGTSLFENYMGSEVIDLLDGKGYSDISDCFKELKEKRNSASEYEENGSNEKLIRNAIKEKWLKGVTKNSDNDWDFGDLNEYASAEIESIIKIQKVENQKVKVYLICTDTVLSVLAAELIKGFFNCEDFEKTKYPNIEVVKIEVATDLGVSDNDEYQKGFLSLMEIVNTEIDAEKQRNKNVKNDNKKGCILNITGGYKAIIPIMTLIGQIREVPLNYLYEDNEQNEKPLLEIGNLPFNFDWDYVEAITDILNETEINQLDKTSKLYKKLLSTKLIEEKEGKATLGTLAKLLKIYIAKTSSLNKGILGLFLEYQLYYYFSLNHENELYDKPSKLKEKVFYNIQTLEFRKSDKPPNGFIEVGDIDLKLINKETTGEVICEVKALSSAKHYKETIASADKDYFLRQVKPRILWHKPQEFHFYVYKVSFSNFNNDFSEDSELQDVLTHFEKSIQEDEDIKALDSKVVFRARGFHVNLRKQDVGINYSDILGEPFDKIEWLDLKNGNLPKIKTS